MRGARSTSCRSGVEARRHGGSVAPRGVRTADAGHRERRGDHRGRQLVSEPRAARLARAVKPIRGQLLRLRLPTRVRVSRHLGHALLHRAVAATARVLVGATVEDVGFDERATAAGVQQLLDARWRLLPALERAAFEEVRVGLRPMTPTSCP